MPQVPVYNQQTVADRALSTPLQSEKLPSDFGARTAQGVGEAASQYVSQAQKIIFEEKRKADDSRTTDALTQLTNFKNDQMYNTKYGAFLKKGSDAFGVVDEYGKTFDEKVQELTDSLDNDQQKEFFKVQANKVRSDYSNQLGKYVFQESVNYQMKTAEEFVKSYQNDAVLNFQEPGKISENLNLMIAKISQQADDLGISDVAKNNLIEQAVSGTHRQIISRMVNIGDDLTAEKYFKANKDQFTAEDIAPTEKLLEEGSLLGETQRRTDQIMSKGLKISESLDEARKVESPRLRESLVKSIKGRFDEINAVQEYERKQMLQSVSQAIENGISPNKIPREQWLSLSTSDRNAFENRWRQVKQGIEPVTDWQRYYDLKTLASTPETQNEFRKMNLELEFSNLDFAKRKELIDLQEGLIKGDKSAKELVNDFRTQQQIVNSTLLEMGINPNDKDEEVQAKVNQFRSAVADRQIALQSQTGKKATNEDIEGIANRLATEVITDRGWIWDSTKRAFEVDKGAIDVDYDQIPRVERKKIEDSLRRNGIPIDEDNVLTIYQKKLQRELNP